MTTLQLPFAFLAIYSLISAHLAAVPALSVERSIVFDGRKVYLLLVGLTFTPTFCESLDLRDAVAQPIEIGTTGLQLVQD